MAKYIYAIGRRKTSVASIRLFNDKGENSFNEKPFSKTYPHKADLEKVTSPLRVADLSEKEFYFTSKASGGGRESQLEAMRMAMARAIVKMSPEKKKALKDAGYLTRDPRMVERKKPGLRKARKAEQYSKR